MLMSIDMDSRMGRINICQSLEGRDPFGTRRAATAARGITQREVFIMGKLLALLVTLSLLLFPLGGLADVADAPPGNGRTIKILLSHSESIYARELSRSGQENDDIYIQKLRELSGYDLQYEFLNHSDYSTQLSLRFASNDLADLVRTGGINSNDHKGAVEQGFFVDMTELLAEHGQNILAGVPEKTWQSPRIAYEGRQYGIPVLTGTVSQNDRIGAFIRQDWLDELGLDSPVTLDDWLAFFEAVKANDLNGDGELNEYGTAMFEAVSYSGFFFGSFSVDPGAWHLRDGELVPDMVTPEMKEAVAFYRDIYEKGYINPDIFTKKGTDWDADIRNGKVAAFAGHAYQYASTYSPAMVEQLFANQPDKARFSMIAPPTGPRGDRFAGLQGDMIYFTWVVPKGTEAPEDIVKFIDWAWSSEAAEDFFIFGIEGHNYTRENGEILFDANAPANLENNAIEMFRLSLNPKEIGMNNARAIATLSESEKILEAYALSDEIMMKNDGLYMPQLNTLQKFPELSPWGTLFNEMFAKVVTGTEPLEHFDDFVSDWYARGGDKVIEEATAWHTDFYG